MDVRSPENKNLIYQILINHPLKTVDHDRFLKAIDNQVYLIYEERFNFKNNLTDMNKEIIRRFSVIKNEIEQKKKKKKKKTKQPVKKNIKITRPVPTHKEQINIFDAKLKNRQDEFIRLVNKDKPKEINFADDFENSEIPSLDSTLAEREKELRNAMLSYNSESAAKWIGNDTVKKTIKIGNEVKLDKLVNQTKSVQKKVSFKLSEKNNKLESGLFLNKLKKKINPVESLDNTFLDTKLDKKKYLENLIAMQKQLTLNLEMLLKSL